MGSFEQIAAIDEKARQLREKGDALRAARIRVQAIELIRTMKRPQLEAVMWQRMGHDLLSDADRLQDALHAFEHGIGALDGAPGADLDALMQRLHLRGKVFEPFDGDPLPAAVADAASQAALNEAEKDPALLSRLLIDAGNGYLAMRQESVAHERYQAALTQRNITTELKLYALVNRGLAERALGKLEDAEGTLREAVALGGEDRHALAALASLQMARVQRARDEARTLYLRAAELAQGADDVTHQARVRVALGLLLLEQGLYDEAAVEYERALALGDEGVRWAALWGLGTIARAHGQLDRAAERLRESVALVERTATALRTDEGKVSFLESAAQASDQLLLVELDRAAAWKASFEPALAAAERARARAFGDLALLWRRTQRAEAASPASPVQMAVGVASGAFDTDFFAPEPAPPEAERKRAKPLARLVYHVFADRTAAFAVSSHGRVRGVVTKLGRDQLAELVKEARAALGVTETLRSARPAAGERPRSAERGIAKHAALRRLHDELVAPLVDGFEDEETLVLEPHGPLWLLPFAALPDKRGRWLGERFAMTLAPSAAALDEIRTEPHTPLEKPSALLIGNPTMPARVRIGDRDVSFSDLPGAEREVRELAPLFADSRLLTGDEATLGAVRDGLDGRDVVHLATHGFALESEPLASGVVLAGDEQPVLTAHDVFELGVDADLVVLSACQTGLGRLTGDGVIGLLRSFLAAGARAVLASLWSVSDDATVALMASFYRHYLGGDDKAQALRKASNELRADFDNPFYWSAFVLAGAPERGRRSARLRRYARRRAAAVAM